MKNKQSKKIDKKALKEKLKKFGFWTLNITCYVATALFIISLIVGSCSKPQQSQVKEPVNTMILRSNSISRYPLNNLKPYKSVEEVSVVDNSSWTLRGVYNSNYIYYNPTYSDVHEAMYSYLNIGDYAYVHFLEPIRVNNNIATYLFLYHANSTSFILGLGFSSGYEDWTIRFNATDRYCLISNPSYYTQAFVDSEARFGFNSLTGVLEANKQFARFLAYYYSTLSFADFSYEFDSNPILAITPYLSTDTLNNGFFFYNQSAYDYLLSLGSYDYVFEITLFEGGFSSNGNYYDRVSATIWSAYNGNNSERNYYLYGSYPGNIDSDRITDSTNDSLKGYFFIGSIYYEHDYRVSTSLGSGWSTEKTEVFSRQRSTSTGIQYVFYENPEWSASMYRYLSVGYISSSTYDFSPFDTIASISAPYSYIVSALGSIIPITPTSNSDTDYPLFFEKVFNWITYAFYGIMPILTFSILPGISLGVILLVPFVITIILFVVKLFKR